MAHAVAHTPIFLGLSGGLAVTDIRSSDICVNFTIIRYEPLEGGSAIDRAVGTQAHWHRHDGTDGLS